MAIAGLLDEAEPDAPEQPVQRLSPIFALASLNPKTAPSAEVRWSQLLSLTLATTGEPLLTVGRSKECKLQLADPRASTRHFEIVVRRKDSPAESHGPEALHFDCVLNDCSSNGTAVNGAIVGKGGSRQLRSGDEICVLPAHRVGDDEMIGFIFRNATERLAEPEQVRSLELDELVTCPICMQIIYKCVALTPCSHNFCMACLSDWMRRKKDCPVCRRHIVAVMKNLPMDNVIEAFLEACPRSKRSDEEKRDMDARDLLRLGQSGRLVRDVCAVAPRGAEVRAHHLAPPGPNGGAGAIGGGLPGGGQAWRAPRAAGAEGAPRRAAQAAGNTGAVVAAPGPGEVEAVGPGSQVCSVQ